MSSIILAGWDAKKGPQIYACTNGGSIIPCANYYGTGSGMAILRGYLEAGYRPNMSYEEARQLLINCSETFTQPSPSLSRETPTQEAPSD